MIVTSPFLILKKLPYRESALLLQGLSPDYGRLSFVLHGGQSLKKSAPEADIFREVEVEFEDDLSGRDMFTAKHLETITDFSALANNNRNYRMAVKIADFLLANSSGEVLIHTYEVTKAVFANLAGFECGHELWDLTRCAVVLKAAFLCENGMLPEAVTQAQNEFLENLIASGVDNCHLPEAEAQYWNSLNEWLNQLITYHKLKK